MVKVKAHIGYDLKLKKPDLKADNEHKKIVLANFPEPEVLPIEPDIQFHDIKSGLFNSFSPDDLTKSNQEAKTHLKQKIPKSGLMDTAKKEAMQAVLLVGKILKTIGWTLDHSALEGTNTEKHFLDE